MQRGGGGGGVTLLQDAQWAVEALLHLVQPHMALLLCLQENNSSAQGGAGALLGGLTTESHKEETCATGAALPVLLWGF